MIFLKKEVKTFFKDSGIRPLKRLGQNFLVNQSILSEIVKAAKLLKKDTVLEIGAGAGNLTVALAAKAKKVIAFEIDKKLFKILQKNVLKKKNVKLYNKDIRKVGLERYAVEKNFKVVANIPYYLTSFIIRKLLLLKKRPQTILLLVQKEVGQRILARPPKMNLLALSVQFFSVPNIIKKVKKGNFWPSPKVDSVLICLKVKTKKEIRKQDPESLLRLAKIGFSEKRKQLKNNIKKYLKIDEKKTLYAFKKAGLNKNVRAQELSLNDWEKLAFFINKQVKQDFFF